MNTAQPKKLIEVAMPVKEISAESVRDKSIRHGHISTLHLWWARRPLPVCRAVVFAMANLSRLAAVSFSVSTSIGSGFFGLSLLVQGSLFRRPFLMEDEKSKKSQR